MSSKGIDRNSWVILKQAWNMSKGGRNGECGNTSFEEYRNLLSKYFGMSKWSEDIVFYCLTAKSNSEGIGKEKSSNNPFEELTPVEVIIPNVYRYEVKHNDDDYEVEEYYDECNVRERPIGESIEYGVPCKCNQAIKEGYDEDGEHWEEDCTGDEEYDNDCECKEYDDVVIQLFNWTHVDATYFSLENDMMGGGCDTIDCLEDDIGERTIKYDADESNSRSEGQRWEDFNDNDNRHVHEWEEEEVTWEVLQLLKDEE